METALIFIRIISIDAWVRKKNRERKVLSSILNGSKKKRSWFWSGAVGLERECVSHGFWAFVLVSLNAVHEVALIHSFKQLLNT